MQEAPPITLLALLVAALLTACLTLAGGEGAAPVAKAWATLEELEEFRFLLVVQAAVALEPLVLAALVDLETLALY